GASRTLSYNNKKCKLTPLPYSILICLIEKKGETVSREDLIKKCWGGTDQVPGTVDRQVSYIRSAFREVGLTEAVINATSGVGFQLVAPCEPINDTNNAKQDYSFIRNLENIYHLTVKDSQIRLAKGWIKLVCNSDGQEIIGEEETNIEEKNI